MILFDIVMIQNVENTAFNIVMYCCYLLYQLASSCMLSDTQSSILENLLWGQGQKVPQNLFHALGFRQKKNITLKQAENTLF